MDTRSPFDSSVLSLLCVLKHGVKSHLLESSAPPSAFIIAKPMTDCRKVPVKSGSRHHRLPATGRETLAMSVIVEEPAHMRESRLKEQEQHPDDIKPSNGSFLDEQRPARNSSHVVTLPSPESNSRSASSSASTTPSSSDERHDSKTVPHQSRAEPLEKQSSKSPRSKHRKSLATIPLRHKHSSHSDPEYTPRSKPAKSIPDEEEARYDHTGRSSRRNTISQSSGPRVKASSTPQSKSSAESRLSSRLLYSLQDERPHSKPSARLDPVRSARSNDMYEWEESRQASRSHSTSLERCRSNSSSSIQVHGKRQMPPFRRPSRPVDGNIPSLQSSFERTSAFAEKRIHRQMPSRPFAASSSGRVKSSSPLNELAPFSENKSYEGRRIRSFKDASPLSRQRSTSNLNPTSRTYAGEERQESKMQMAPNSKLLPSKSEKNSRQSSSALLSVRDPTRTRSTSLLPMKSSARASRGESSPPSSPSTSRLPSYASTSPPSMSAPEFPLRLRHYEGRFSNRRSQTLFYFSLFPPEKMPMRGVVLFLHGIGDHCRRNVNLFERLCREGFGVITYDLLNHGVSDLDEQKTRANISDFNHLVDDTNDFITFAKRSIYLDALRYWRKNQNHRYYPRGQKSNPDIALFPELPLVIAGSSFGCLIGIYTILSGQHKFGAAVWSSPTIGILWSPLLWAEAKLAKPLASVIPRAKIVPAIQHDLLSRDPKFLRRFQTDPLTSTDMMTMRTGHEALQAMIQLQEDARITDPSSAFCAVPTLFFSGSADVISDQQATIKFFATMGNFDKEFKLFDGLFHMVYEEPEKEDVFRYLAQWLHRRFPDASISKVLISC